MEVIILLGILKFPSDIASRKKFIIPKRFNILLSLPIIENCPK